MTKQNIIFLYTLFNSSHDAVNDLFAKGGIWVGHPCNLICIQDLLGYSKLLKYCVRYEKKS